MEDTSARVVKLEGILTGLHIDELLSPFHHSLPTAKSPLAIDMSGVNFMHVECFPPLIAEIAARQSEGLLTTIRLPRSAAVRQSFRTWDLARILRLVTGTPFIEFVDRRDHRFFHGLGGDLSTREYGLETHQLHGERISLPPSARRTMPLKHWRVSDFFVEGDPLRFQRAVLDETQLWREDAGMRAVLEYHLGEFYGHVWTHIIHEALSNAFRHGSATSVVAAVKADWTDRTQKDAHFTLSFWDDGKPMYETLRAGLAADGIVAPAFAMSEELGYHVKHTARGVARAFDRTSRDLPTVDSPDEEFFVAALYPGVTSDPEGRLHVPHPDVGSSESLAALAGMGLANLVNAAVDVLKGSVAFRSGSYFMNVKAAALPRGHGQSKEKRAGQYAVKTEYRWSSHGNIVTVRLPLRGKK